MSTSAQRDLYAESFEEQASLGATGTDGAAVLRRLAVERLAEHRNRRTHTEPRAAETASAAPTISEAAQRACDRVAARYQQRESYHEFWQAQPVKPPVLTPPSPWVEEPVHVAKPVAAAENVTPGVFEEETVIASAQTLLIEDRVSLQAENASHEIFSAAALEPSVAQPLDEELWDWQNSATPYTGELEVRPFEELPQPQPLPDRSNTTLVARSEELQELEEEIAFRLDPEFAEHYIDPLPIQANIIEFPRQLVATKKARPRLAEGPLGAETVAAQPEPVHEFQMRIFEVEDPLMAQTVEPELATESNVAVEVQSAAQWQELVLDAPKAEYIAALQTNDSETISAMRNLPVASFELRFMSALVDGVCVAVTFTVFVSVALWMSGQAAELALRDLSLPMQIVASLAAMALMLMVYQAAFFSLGASTLGMSYAGLEFLTLTCRRPSRRMLRRRVGANLLAVAPLGVGLLWSLLDKRSLGWNDKISGVFLREF